MMDRVQELLRAFAASDANAAALLCDQHPARDTAFTVVDGNLKSIDLSYGELREKSTQFAAALSTLGIGRGDHVATLMGNSAELVIALLGIWRVGAVNVPLLTAFAHDEIDVRLRSTDARLVICDANQRRKLVPPGETPTDASRPVVVARGDAYGYDHSFVEMVMGVGPFADLGETAVAVATEKFDAGSVTVGGDGALVQMFTSGTSGTPQQISLPLRAVATFAVELESSLDVRNSDVLWTVADSGSAFGLYFAILGPMATGQRSLLMTADVSAPLVWAVVEKFSVTNFVASAAAYKALGDGPMPDQGHKLRRATSAGEPLTPDRRDWGREVLGLEVREFRRSTGNGKADRTAESDPEWVAIPNEASAFVPNQESTFGSGV